MGFQKGSSGFKGKHTEHTKLLLSLNHKGKMTGKKHPLWTGRYPAYRTLHSWVVRYLGQPDTCNHCGTKATGHKMHWANKDGIYRRVKKDWIRLCAKCHGAYDKLLNLRKQRRILI